eukprot:84124_1
MGEIGEEKMAGFLKNLNWRVSMEDLDWSVAVSCAIISVALAVLWYAGGSKKKHVGPALCPREYRPFTLKKRREINHNTVFFRFALQNSTTQLGLPVGQHFRFRCTKENGDIVERDYTPISSDRDLGHFDLMIKIYDKGAMTQHLHRLRPGDTLDVRGPRGAVIYSAPGVFTFPFLRPPRRERTVKHVGMLAGGTGITPMLQIIRQIEYDATDRTRVTLLFGNLSEKDILLRGVLDEINQKSDNVDVRYIVDKASESSEWNGDVGYMTPEIIAKYMPDPAGDMLVMTCGPDGMVEAMKKNLASLGYSKEMLHFF